MRVWPVVWLVLGLGCRPPGYGGDHPDAAARSDAHHAGDGTTATDAAIDAPVAGICNQGFHLDNHASAQSVWLTGDFVAWAGDPAHGATALTLGGATWTGTRAFTAGTYLYKLIVDGNQWIADPSDPNSVDDGFGGKNSVYTCTP